jgi:2-desacetyl-2-hydroxyethyl bacteriochlorophyllide A dehydrogenase
VFQGPHEFSLDQREVVEPQQGEVRVRTAYVGICGSDLHGYTGESGRRVAGMVMGHEVSGWVEAVGDGVPGDEIGRAVTVNPASYCDGTCGHRVENQCADLRVLGVTPDFPGALADTFVVAADRLVGLDGLSLEVGAAVEPMAVGLHAVRRAGVQDGDSVLIIGGGMIGQCVARAARLAGAGPITISEGIESRRSAAIRAGFEAVPPEAADGLPLVTKVFDAVGLSATASVALRSLVRGGVACFVGLGKPEISIPLFEVVVQERTIVGTFAYTDEVFRETARLLASGQLEVEDLIGGIESFDRTATAFEDLATGQRDDLKILIGTGASAPEPSP